MSMMKEFKEFAMKGNLVDMAVAFVMGAAFTKVTTAFISGMVMPLIGQLTGGINFSDKKIILTEGAAEITDASGAVTTAAVSEVAVAWGSFITVTIEFLVVAFVMFMVIKSINKMKKAEPAPAPAGPSNEEKLLMEIRDALKK
ncbi:MAG: large-conductance mechanosensitive channel protein MscL [Flavobacteriales bacterium]|jgi:large conductance mechanosensitive channel|nr:large-conductance mechanosensitive channel protein MscL [Flavobacteriales bacterium]MBK6549035.1 large-conductance mechanosensitive channel protein MscL [Flavobacteriales bacterium]MBK6884372.1 large-conductance mechanosensitive channel protein MscL [Flavobacteriales bacterium]MBK7100768.1 large-conductance mechanosensitive channel protein MscL [Flavobacteriales bacterium]MBK7111456.1 large-conductance mechanosensitive channel protein MscL [Flavobacteriales bacterium]